jgi:hypothetical protein
VTGSMLIASSRQMCPRFFNSFLDHKKKAE